MVAWPCLSTSSYFMFFDTAATKYAKTAVYDLTNMGQTEISGLYDTFAPSYVPEPGSIALLGLGMAEACCWAAAARAPQRADHRRRRATGQLRRI
ncbi:PEP-CTERM sorting domain-containing protein [Massilia sp. B-10]|nr:PEP-CTERM sorting domain-containing protein [Massilia sp. B-10]